VLQLKGDFEGAKTYFLAAAELLQRVLPPGHPHTLSAMLGLAQVEQKTDPARVEQRYEEVLSMILAQETPDLILLAATQNALGGLIVDRSLEITDDPAEAERLQRKALRHFTAALESYERLPGDKRPARKLKLVEHNLCKLKHARGRFPEAMEMLELYVDLQLQQGRRTEAIPLLHKAIAMGTPADSVDLRIRLADLLWKHDPLRRTDAVEMVSEAEVALRSGDATDHERLERWLREHTQ
jgi:tetratricopeptide (TPR) repeat protein